MHTGNITRNKKFKLDVGANNSRLYMCSRGQTIPEQKKAYSFGWKRKKQLIKAILVDALNEDWISNKDFIDFIMGEGLIPKMKMLALVSTFDREKYLENKSEELGVEVKE